MLDALPNWKLYAHQDKSRQVRLAHAWDGEFCTQSVNMYCPYVNCCCFFCTVWSTVNAPVQFFCTVCPYVNCLLFFCTVCPYVNCLLFFCTVCPYVNMLLLFFCCCCCFFCTVWSTVNAPVQFFLHCLSICKLFVVFFALSGARS